MGYLAFVLVLLILVLVHEFGHFIVAKKSGIRVDEFGFGFPPKLFGKKFGETEYTFNLLPIGGFVRIFGETPDEEAIDGPDSSRSFVNKPAYIQAAVLVAGVFFNMILAWLLFSTVLMMGVPYTDEGETPFDGDVTNVALTISSVGLGTPTEKAGLMVGDRIMSITSGEDILMSDVTRDIDEFLPEFQGFVGGHAQEGVVVSYERGGEMYTSDSMIPIVNDMEDAPNPYIVGMGLGYIGTLSLPIHQALIEGAGQTWYFSGEMVRGFASLIGDSFKGEADYDTLAGPVGIAGIVSDAADTGIIHLMMIMAIISINLAVLNLLPFPALDGGRLLFLLIEVVKGSPIKPAVANIINLAGFAILLLLMIGVTYLDISRIVAG